MCNGTLIRKDYDEGGYGNYIIMKDDTTNMGFLYAHMREQSPLSVGDKVTIGQYVGHEGTTGYSTGIHLHVEMQDLTDHDWVFGAPKSYYTNPATFMGFPNVEGISVIYYGTPGPEPPEPPTPTILKKKKFPWQIFTRIIRKRRNIF